MEKIKYYLEKYKILISILIVILVLLSVLFYVFLNSSNKEEEIVKNIEVKEEIKVTEDVKVEEKVKVDIKGFVKKPGVYEMNTDDRVVDVIKKAGGLKEDANTEYINLSKKVIDEMIIIIYSNNEIEKFKETEKEIIYIEYECICPDNINDTCITESDTVNTNDVDYEKKEENSVETSDNSKDNLISINTATLEELMTLSGIGESKAQAIIDYRTENGKFEKLEDIMKVSGIGESAYSKIKDNIKL